MGAILAGRQAIGAVVRNPILIVAVSLIAILQAPQLLAQSIASSTAAVASLAISLLFFLFFPFYFGGIIGMGNEAIEGQTNFRTFVSAGKTNYFSIFGAYLLAIVGVILYVIALGIIGGIAGAAILFTTGNASGTALLGIIGFAVVAFLLYLLPIFFLQFFAQAIVLDDMGAVSGFKRSIGVVRGHKLSTLGYTLIVTLIGGLFGAFGGIFAVLQNPATGSGLPTLSLTGSIIAVAIFVVLAGIIGAFSSTYSVAFYKQISSPSSVE